MIKVAMSAGSGLTIPLKAALLLLSPALIRGHGFPLGTENLARMDILANRHGGQDGLIDVGKTSIHTRPQVSRRPQILRRS
ncbi:MAG: hypothetical protein WEB53_08840, partial [Akkermansiaceae bacterium]